MLSVHDRKQTRLFSALHNPGFVPFIRNKFQGMFQDFSGTFPGLRLILTGLKFSP